MLVAVLQDVSKNPVTITADFIPVDALDYRLIYPCYDKTTKTYHNVMLRRCSPMCTRYVTQIGHYALMNELHVTLRCKHKICKATPLWPWQ